MKRLNPTDEAYAELRTAFDYYNKQLFDGVLPHCLITMQREKRTMGYFSSARFQHRKDGTKADEIAMNPEYFAVIPLVEILQTLVHEMVHLWQEHFGRSSRKCYHNREWADKMEAVGLMPSSTGQPGGKRTGQMMSDYPIKNGRFETSTRALIESGFAISWLDRHPVATSRRPTPMLEKTVDQPNHDDVEALPAFVKAAYVAPISDEQLSIQPRGNANYSNREKYTCPTCRINVWGKPGLRILCADCNGIFLAA